MNSDRGLRRIIPPGSVGARKAAVGSHVWCNEIGKTGPGHRDTSHAFNPLDRLVSVSSPGSAPVRYGYNTDGQRVLTDKGKGSGSGETERFLRFGRGRPMLAELSGGKINTRYIVLPSGELLARVGPTDSRAVYYHFDALGSAVALTDALAHVVTRFDYDPYGGRRSHPATKELYGFVGAESVSEDGGSLLEMGLRFYDPDSGRFVSRDPFWGHVPGPRNPYSYARGNPVRLIDPAGLQEGTEPLASTTTPETIDAVTKALEAAAKAAAEAVKIGQRPVSCCCPEFCC